jgi:hypothetical protein
VAGAKDDRRDARVLADSLVHRHGELSTRAVGRRPAHRAAGAHTDA